jgi:hypothetical protein
LNAALDAVILQALARNLPISFVNHGRGDIPKPAVVGVAPWARWDISAMARSMPPPPGFDALPAEDQIEYVQSLWERIAATAGQVPL